MEHDYRNLTAALLTAAYYLRVGPADMPTYRGPAPADSVDAKQVQQKGARDEVSATYREFLKLFPKPSRAEE